MKLGEIASLLKCAIVGDPEVEITGAAPIEAAKPGAITFLSNRKYNRYLATTGASAIILENPDGLPDGKAAIISSSPYLTFAEAMNLLYPPVPFERGIHPSAVISSSAIIGENVSVGPFTVIGDHAVIGKNVSVHAHCVVYPKA